MAKILLVEDDINLSEIYQARMEAEGYAVIAAPDGESALAVAAKEKPDLIISDVMMPKISGFEMLDILRNTDGLKHTRVIMLTALGQAEDQSRAEHLGADKYLVKSQVTLEDIVTAAQELLGDTPQNPPAPTTASASEAAPAAAASAATASTAPAQPAPTGPLAATTPAPLPEPPAAAQPEAQATPVATGPAQPAVASMSVQPTPAEPAETPAPAKTTAAPAASPEQPAAEAPATEAQPQDPAPQVTTPQPVPEPQAAAEVAPLAEVMTAEDNKAAAEATDSQPEPSESTPAPEPTPALQTPALAPADNATPVTAAPAQPAPTAAPAAGGLPTTAEAIDEQVVANAIDKLLAKTPQAEAATDESGAAISPDSPDGERPARKVIAPIEHPDTPSLQELLAKEDPEAGNSMATDTAAPPIPVDPNDPDAVALPKPQAEKANSDADTKHDSNFDPNRISL